MDYVPVFVANGFYKNRTAFKREHVVYNTFTKFPKVDRYISQGKLLRLRKGLLVEMPFQKHTTRHSVETPLAYDKVVLEKVLKDRWHVYEERPLRDVGEMFSVARKVVNSDPSRLEMVKELWKKHPKLIVFYNFNYELEALRLLVEYFVATETSTGFSSSTRSIGKWQDHGSPSMTLTGIPGLSESLSNTSNRTPSSLSTKTSIQAPKSSSISSGIALSVATSQRNVPQHWENEWTTSTGTSTERCSKTSPTGTCSNTQTSGETGNGQSMALAEWNGHKHQPIPSTDRWLYLVQYTAGAEGWNCIETDAMIMYSLNYSWKVSEQAEGRIDRLNTPFRDLWYYKFTSDSWIDQAIERSLRAKETFNEAKYVGLFPG
jgi:hypothetical protein